MTCRGQSSVDSGHKGEEGYSRDQKRETVTIELEGDEEMRTPAFDRECENVRLMNSKSARVLVFYKINLALEFFYIPLLHLTITS